MRLNASSVWLFVASLPFFICVLFGIKSFEIWGQITYIWGGRPSPIILILEGSAHALRYTLLYPVLVFSEFFNFDHDVVFSYLVLVSMFITVRNIFRSAEIILGRRLIGVVGVVAVVIPIETLFFLMNGRGTISFLGYSICFRILIHLIYHRELNTTQMILLFVGIVMCSVSSGVLASAYMSILIGVGAIIHNMVKQGVTKNSLKAVFGLVLLLGIFFIFFLIGIQKNLDFYGGGLEGFKGLLSHGAGYVLIGFVDVPFLTVLTALGGMILFAMLIARFKHPQLALFICTTLACGAFGYSTLAIAAIPVLTWLSLLIARLRFSAPRMAFTQVPAQALTVAKI